MRLLLCSILFLYYGVSFSQDCATPDTSINVGLSANEATCGNNGTITINPSGGSGSGYSWAITGGPNYTGTANYVSTNPLTSLSSGIHTITIRDGNGNCNYNTVEVTSTYTAPVPDFDATNETCPADDDGSIDASSSTVAAGQTAEYALIPSPFTASPVYGTTAVFQPLTAGTYRLFVRDQPCGNVRTTDVTITENTTPLTYNTIGGPQWQVACGNVGIRGSAAGGSGPYTLKITNPSGVVTSAMYNTIADIPNIVETTFDANTDGGTFNVEITDACGLVANDTVDIIPAISMTSFVGCDDLGNETIAISVNARPRNPDIYHELFAGTDTSATPIQTGTQTNSGLYTFPVGVAPGQYTVVSTLCDGTTQLQTTQVFALGNTNIVSSVRPSTCLEGYGEVLFNFDQSRMAFPTFVITASTNPAFPVGYELTEGVDYDWDLGRLYYFQLLPGSYTIEARPEGKQGACAKSVNVVVDDPLDISFSSVEENTCGTASSAISTTFSTNQPEITARFELRNSAGTTVASNNTGDFFNITPLGTYSVIAILSNSNVPTPCTLVKNLEVELTGYLTMINKGSNGLICDDGSVLINAGVEEGLNDYTFEVIEVLRAGTPIGGWTTVPSGPVTQTSGEAAFEISNVQDGDIVRVNVKDSCGDENNLEIPVQTLANPTVTASSMEICPAPFPGSTVTLKIPPIAGATYTWTGPNGVLSSTSESITLEDLATGDEGVYTVQANIGSGCKLVSGNFTIDFDTQCARLPVELAYFEAELNQNGEVELLWRTETEENNDRFEIERSADAQSWTVIHTAAGAGTTQTPVNYNTVDATPLSNQNFYRLKQIDYDGTYAYSDVRLIVFNTNNKLVLFPNPTKDVIYVNTNNTIEKVEIYSVNGKQYTAKVDHNQLSIGHLTTGMYFIRLHTSEGVSQHKIVKE